MISSYPKEMEDFFRENMDGRTNKELADLVNKKFGTHMTRENAKGYIQNHHLHRKVQGKRPKRHGLYSQEVIAYIMENYKGVGPLEMSGILNEKFGTSYTKDQIKAFYARNHLDSGLTGRWGEERDPSIYEHDYSNCGKYGFQPGSIPYNQKPVGSETKRSDGYWRVKVADPNVWKFKHVIVWEQVHGPVEKGMVVTFLDGNTDNCSIDNLVCISHAESKFLNQNHLRSKDSEITQTGINIAKLNTAIHKIEKKKKENKKC